MRSGQKSNKPKAQRLVPQSNAIPNSPTSPLMPKDEESSRNPIDPVDAEVASAGPEVFIKPKIEVSPTISMVAPSTVERPTESMNELLLRCFDVYIKPDKTEASALDGVVVEFDRLELSRTQTVFLLPATRQRTHRKKVRGRVDAWRRYGAQKIIHEVGGHVVHFTAGNKRKKRVVAVKPQTPMPPAPKEQPILTMDEFYRRPIVLHGAQRSGMDDGFENTCASDIESESSTSKSSAKKAEELGLKSATDKGV